MTILVIAAGLALAVWILRPVFGPPAEIAQGHEEIERLLEMKHAIYRSIIDLEHDARLGKVSAEDEQAIRRQHESEAIAIIRQLDAAATVDGVTDQIEREIADARARLKGNG